MNATYSPEDNKLRLYTYQRLDSETYQRVRSAGFIWAPKQQLFVAPTWTPGREDLLIELCGEIGDEDTSLVERAEERAERFEEYSDKRLGDAERARESVSAITDNIPLGQPILVGHHSERHARRDAERIENGMRKAVNMWETSKYWTYRAQGAIRAAKYKERPDVRARRIKGLEADLRKAKKEKGAAELFLKLWGSIEDDSMIKSKEGTEGTPLGRAVYIANRDHVSKCFTLDEYPRELPTSQYEGSMSLWSALTDGIITAEQAQEIAIRVHTKAIKQSERWMVHYENRLAYERAMLQESGGTAVDKTGPEKGGACKCWASPRGGYSYIQKVNRVSVTVLDNWGNGGNNFTRTIPFDKLSEIMTAAEVQTKRDAGLLIEDRYKTGFILREMPHAEDVPAYQPPERTEFDDMKDALKEGVKVVSAPQLFPTPPEIAEKMVELADLPVADPALRILEPSAGTGNLIEAIFTYAGEIVAVEKNLNLVDLLRVKYSAVNVIGADFLSCNGNLGKFDRVIMNPPFENASDIKHIEHALTMLKPGGKLVALCANGPRQRTAFLDRADYWENLPGGSFKDQGTSVNVALMVING